MNNLPKEVLEDIQKMKGALGKSLVSISLFGSNCHKQFNESNDIDLALFVRNVSLSEVRDKVVGLQFNFPVEGKYINGTYRGPEKSVDKSGKYYDLVVLNHEAPNEDFMSINDGKLLQLEI